MFTKVFVLLVSAIVSAPLHAAERFTENTLRLAKGEARPSATIGAMAWLAGTWTGSGLGGDNEEIWSAPRDGVMMGMYRMTKAGRPVFYELLTLSEVNGSLELRLRHFDAGLRAWEEKDISRAFPYVTQRERRIYFEGITFEPRGDELTVYLAIEDRKEAWVREEIFHYTRSE